MVLSRKREIPAALARYYVPTDTERVIVIKAPLSYRCLAAATSVLVSSAAIPGGVRYAIDHVVTDGGALAIGLYPSTSAMYGRHDAFRRAHAQGAADAIEVTFVLHGGETRTFRLYPLSWTPAVPSARKRCAAHRRTRP